MALYDYEAGDTNEIGFAEGDRILDISHPSDDWWMGTNASTGETGLFPAVSCVLEFTRVR